jgi:hypothetical protein
MMPCFSHKLSPHFVQSNEERLALQRGHRRRMSAALSDRLISRAAAGPALGVPIAVRTYAFLAAAS